MSNPQFAQFANLALVLGLVQISNYLNIENPEYLVYLRSGYIISFLVNFLSLVWIRLKIMKNQDNTQLIYEETKNIFDKSDKETITQTVMEYDLSQLKNQFNQLFIGAVMMVFLHYKFGLLRPVFFQIIMGFKTLYSTPLFQVYIMSKPTTGELNRPWKAASPFGMSTAEPITPKELKNQQKKEIKESKKKS